MLRLDFYAGGTKSKWALSNNVKCGRAIACNFVPSTLLRNNLQVQCALLSVQKWVAEVYEHRVIKVWRFGMKHRNANPAMCRPSSPVNRLHLRQAVVENWKFESWKLKIENWKLSLPCVNCLYQKPLVLELKSDSWGPQVGERLKIFPLICFLAHDWLFHTLNFERRIREKTWKG